MNPKPIEEAKCSILRGSHKALLRAAMRAREIALKTGTSIVVTRNGVIEHLDPQSMKPIAEK
jgi:hypothetical protein